MKKGRAGGAYTREAALDVTKDIPVVSGGPIATVWQPQQVTGTTATFMQPAFTFDVKDFPILGATTVVSKKASERLEKAVNGYDVQDLKRAIDNAKDKVTKQDVE